MLGVAAPYLGWPARAAASAAATPRISSMTAWRCGMGITTAGLVGASRLGEGVS